MTDSGDEEFYSKFDREEAIEQTIVSMHADIIADIQWWLDFQIEKVNRKINLAGLSVDEAEATIDEAKATISAYLNIRNRLFPDHPEISKTQKDTS